MVLFIPWIVAADGDHRGIIAIVRCAGDDGLVVAKRRQVRIGIGPVGRRHPAVVRMHNGRVAAIVDGQPSPRGNGGKRLGNSRMLLTSAPLKR